MTYTEVGVDGSASSRAAVRWAAAEAGRRALPLRVLLAYHWRIPGNRFASGVQLELAAQEFAELAVAEATSVSPGLAVTGHILMRPSEEGVSRPEYNTMLDETGSSWKAITSYEEYQEALAAEELAAGEDMMGE